MDRNEIIEDVKPQMPERRWIHTEGVMLTSVELAHRYGEDPIRAELAAIIHDVAKYWPLDAQKLYIQENQLNEDLLSYDKELWHSEIGYHVAYAKYGINDDGIRDAIRYHTTGRRGMTKIEKIVWLADYIEPGRSFTGVDEARRLAEISLEDAILFGLNQTITFLNEKGKRIYPLTVEARNGLIEENLSK